MSTISPRFPAQKLSKYPHMFPKDIAVWERFLDTHKQFFDGFDYDVKVGNGWDPGQHVDQNIRTNAIELTKKRIDCVGYRLGEIWIVEVKEVAGLSAPGQVMGYVHLYQLKFTVTRRIIPCIVCEAISPDTREVARKFGVQIFVV